MQDSIKLIQDRLRHALDDETTVQQYSWWLLEKATGKTKADLLTHNALLNEQAEHTLSHWLDEMIYYHKPIAYILQEMPFGELTLTVRPPILIPRPETEEWVMRLIEQIQQSGARQLRILDMCTGSGCIALSLAHAFPDAQVYACDISPFALLLVEENKKKLGISNVTCIESDLFAAVSPELTFDLIVTNPPYISDREFARLDLSVKNWEDTRALLAEDEGLALITKIIEQAPSYLRSNDALQKHAPQLTIEIGWQQGAAVHQLMEKAGFEQIKIAQDSARKDRTVSGSVSHVAVTAAKK